MKKRLVALWIALVLSGAVGMAGSARGEDRDWWQDIQKAAGACFRDQLGVKILYSRRMRQEVQQKQIAFVQAAAAVWRELETARLQLAARKKMMGMMGDLLLTDGLASILKHFAVVDQIAEREATIIAADQVLASYVETCTVPDGQVERKGDGAVQGRED